MIVLVNGSPVAIKSGSSFDYVSENRLFLGRDDYTLNISFPIEGCPQNVAVFGHITRKDIRKEKVYFDCEIIDGDFHVAGSLFINKVNESMIEGQFAKGKCEQAMMDKFEDIKICDLNIGGYPSFLPSEIKPEACWHSINSGAYCVALPWINEQEPLAPNNWVDFKNDEWVWADDVEELSWQPYLIYVARKVLEQCGYTYDFSCWERSQLRCLLLCNTIPGVWNQRTFNAVLPNWTVTEFFEALEGLLVAEFDFDHRKKHVTMTFSEDAANNARPVQIDNVLHAHSVDISSTSDNRCEYIGAKRRKFKDNGSELWPYMSCDWYVYGGNSCKSYQSLTTLIDRNKAEGEPFDGSRPGSRLTTKNTLLYAEDVATYFVFRSIGTKKLTGDDGRIRYQQIYALQPVNQFGVGRKPDSDEKIDEINCSPVPILDTYISDDDDRGSMMALSPGSFESDYEHVPSGYDELDDYRSRIRQPLAASLIEKGEDSGGIYYDTLFVAYWDGHDFRKTPVPVIDEVMIINRWEPYLNPMFSLRLGSGHMAVADRIPKINEQQKFSFSWLSDSIPNPRAVFYINGLKYVCEKITANFTENGMSKLLKGDFYQII